MVGLITTEEGSSRKWLWAILALGLALRLTWWATQVATINASGAEYARLAQNLLSGQGYVGISGRSGQFPLYAVLMLFGGRDPRHVEFAGRLVSLVSGLGLIGLMYSIAKSVFGESAALLAALFGACHPILVALSVAVLSESLFLALAFLALQRTIAFVGTQSLSPALGTGAALGLAYLDRPEAVVLAPVMLGTMFFSALLPGWRWSTALRSGLLSFAVLVVVASPYLIFQSVTAGKFVWNSKTGVVDVLNTRTRAGMSFGEAAYGLAPIPGAGSAYRQGPLLTPDWYAFIREPENTPPPHDWRQSLSHVRGNVRTVRNRIWYAGLIGAPTLLVLALIGAVASGWWRRHPWGGLALLGMSTVQGVVLLSVDFLADRYLYVLVPAAALWAAAGVERIAAGIGSLTRRWLIPRCPPAAEVFVGMVFLGLFSVRLHAGVTQTFDFREGKNDSVRPAADWVVSHTLGRDPAIRPIMMGWSAALAFESNSVIRYLPAGSEVEALGFIQRLAPAFIAVRSQDRNNAQYAEAWLEDGIPTPCAVPGFSTRSREGDTVRIWTWRCGPDGESPAEAAPGPRRN